MFFKQNLNQDNEGDPRDLWRTNPLASAELVVSLFLLISLPPFSLSGSVSHVLRGACGGCGMVASASFQLIASINFGDRVFNDSYFLAAQSLTFFAGNCSLCFDIKQNTIHSKSVFQGHN